MTALAGRDGLAGRKDCAVGRGAGRVAPSGVLQVRVDHTIAAMENTRRGGKYPTPSDFFISHQQRTSPFFYDTRHPTPDPLCTCAHLDPLTDGDGPTDAPALYRATRIQRTWHSVAIGARSRASWSQPWSPARAWAFPSSLAPALRTNPVTNQTRNRPKDWCCGACAL